MTCGEEQQPVLDTEMLNLIVKQFWQQQQNNKNNNVKIAVAHTAREEQPKTPPSNWFEVIKDKDLQLSRQAIQLNELSGQIDGYSALVLKKTKYIEELEINLAKIKKEQVQISELMKPRATNYDNREYEIKMKDILKENGRL